jgi:hypothetical protein
MPKTSNYTCEFRGDSALTADVVRLMNLGLFPRLCVAIGLKTDCKDLNDTSARSWELYSPMTADRRFHVTLDEPHNWIRFQPTGNGNASVSGDGQSVIELQLSDGTIEWEDGPILCADGSSIVVAGAGFSSLYEYATGKPSADCVEAIEPYSEHPWALNNDLMSLFESV